MQNRFTAFFGREGRWTEKLKTIVSYAIVSLIVFLTINVVLRYFFEKPLVFTEEVTGYGLAFIVFMGLGYTLRVGGHVTTDVLMRHLSGRMTRVLKIPVIIGGVLFGFLLAVSAWMLMIKNYQRGVIDFGSLGTPEWIPNLIFVVGSTLFLVEMIAILFKGDR